ncbi:hypothetical protein GCM10010193_57920 [Kitasatospora atroaurantiaca]|uniref:Uncharacterized protein n=1 Tax=Kitasatospora atroaurantiaca TaxID=285545 RepID=A0A561F1Y2_9ACTN|nr:hypothetical protein FB465_7107 [Kitasatospora atroaurantiaca]
MACGITWALGEIRTATVLIALTLQWAKPEERHPACRDRAADRHPACRDRAADRHPACRDRAADRDSNAEPAAYNTYPASLDKRGQRIADAG